MTIAIVLDFIIFLSTLACVLKCFRKEGRWDSAQGRKALRFFTLLSNIFCGLSALLVAVAALAGNVPKWIWLLKYLGTASVTVTLVTVMVYLGPNVGYKPLLSGKDLYLHLLGPLLAIVSFCFLERVYPLPFALAMIGILPVAVYGTIYLHKVIFCPDGRRWDDFYGYNRNGKWPLSFVLMVLEAFLISVLLWGLYRI